ncbi:Transcriptional regulator PadR-like family protein [uncultured archaeon]|nr:Transcriptional regulator PadR-like family protein [uncultured archaeon]
MDADQTKPIKRLRNLLTAGNLWLYVLSLIRQGGKVYAYELPDKIEKDFFFRPSRVMIYVVLYKLEAEGLISSEFEERRKYYHLTEAGKKTLEKAKDYFALLAKRL